MAHCVINWGGSGGWPISRLPSSACTSGSAGLAAVVDLDTGNLVVVAAAASGAEVGCRNNVALLTLPLEWGLFVTAGAIDDKVEGVLISAEDSPSSDLWASTFSGAGAETVVVFGVTVESTPETACATVIVDDDSISPVAEFHAVTRTNCDKNRPHEKSNMFVRLLLLFRRSCCRFRWQSCHLGGSGIWSTEREREEVRIANILNDNVNRLNLQCKCGVK